MRPVVSSRAVASSAPVACVASFSALPNQNHRQKMVPKSTIATAPVERRRSVVVVAAAALTSSSSTSTSSASPASSSTTVPTSRRNVLAAAATSSSSTSPASSSSTRSPDAEYLALKGVKVYPASEDEGVAPVEVLSLFRAAPEDRTLMLFLTHGGDLAPQELFPRLARKLPSLRAQGVRVLVFLMGTPRNAAAFAKTVGLEAEVQSRSRSSSGGSAAAASSSSSPSSLFFADPDASTYKALGFSEGFNPELPLLGKGALPPWARLVAMLVGLGSPGTMSEVARGYRGDRNAPPVFEGAGPFDILGKGYQRPMELATKRLNSAVTVVSRWRELAPPDAALLPRLGGALALRGRRTVFRHDDEGILRYVDLDKLVRAASDERALPPGAE